MVSSGKCCQKVKYGVRCSGMSIRFPSMKFVGDLGRGREGKELGYNGQKNE